METVTEKQVLSQEELNVLKSIQTDTQSLTWELGEISLIQTQLDNRKEVAQNYLKELEERERTFNQGIVEQYGKISLNLENGEFTKID